MWALDLIIGVTRIGRGQVALVVSLDECLPGLQARLGNTTTRALTVPAINHLQQILLPDRQARRGDKDSGRVAYLIRGTGINSGDNALLNTNGQAAARAGLHI